MASALIVVRLNDRLRPMDRGDLFEDPLDEFLRRYDIGEVSGASQRLARNGEVAFCELEISVRASADDAVDVIKPVLEQLGAPKGSKLIVAASKREVPVGTLEGMAVYLNGTDLPPAVYNDSDINVVFEEFNRLLAPDGRIHSYWEGVKETALYMYGASFTAMRASLAEFLASYPLCQRARVVQIA